jgi:hypothetical protein
VLGPAVAHERGEAGLLGKICVSEGVADRAAIDGLRIEHDSGVFPFIRPFDQDPLDMAAGVETIEAEGERDTRIEAESNGRTNFGFGRNIGCDPGAKPFLSGNGLNETIDGGSDWNAKDDVFHGRNVVGDLCGKTGLTVSRYLPRSSEKRTNFTRDSLNAD